MSSFVQWSLVAVSIASSVYSTPLSTSPFYNVSPSPLTLAPLLASDHPHGTINNSYIVMLKDDLPGSMMENHMNFLLAAHTAHPLVGDDMAGVSHVYDGHITGYAGRFSEKVVEQIRRMPEVAYVEKDQIVRTQEVQRGAPWVSITALSSLRHIRSRRRAQLSMLTSFILGSCAYKPSTQVDFRHFH